MIEIKAQNGTYLTQSAVVSNENRIFVSKVFTYDENLWRQISEEEKLQYELLKNKDNESI